MEQDILEKLEAQERKIDAIHISVEKTRKYFLWTLIITIVVVILPLVAAIFLVPFMLNSLVSALSL